MVDQTSVKFLEASLTEQYNMVRDEIRPRSQLFRVDGVKQEQRIYKIIEYINTDPVVDVHQDIGWTVLPDLLIVRDNILQAASDLYQTLMHKQMSIFVEMDLKVVGNSHEKWVDGKRPARETKTVTIYQTVGRAVETVNNFGIVVNREKAIKPAIDRVIINLGDEIKKLEIKGSGWLPGRILAFTVSFHAINKPVGRGFVELPDWVANKKACVNVKTPPGDQKCFGWAICAALMKPKKNAERRKQYEHLIGSLKMESIQYPVECSEKSFKRFEKQNQGFALYVYVVDEEEMLICPFYRSIRPTCQRKVDILYYNEHYVAVRDISKLLGRSISKRNGKHHYCRNCSLNFITPEALTKHEENCFKNGPQLTVLPTVDSVREFTRFTHYSRQRRHQFVIYADFESTIKDDKHIANSYCMYLVTPDQSLNKLIVKTGNNSNTLIKEFYQDLESIYRVVGPMMKGNKKLTMTKKDYRRFDAANACALCETEFKSETDKCRDHDHVTGQFRDALCNNCNRQCWQQNMIPVIFHNLKGYDSHLLMHDLECVTNLTAIPQAGGKFLSFTVDKKFCFIDSLQFLTNSLDGLVSSLKAGVTSLDVCEIFKPIDADKIATKLEKMFEKLQTYASYGKLYDGYEGPEAPEQFKRLKMIWKHASGTTEQRFNKLMRAIGASKKIYYSQLLKLAKHFSKQGSVPAFIDFITGLKNGEYVDSFECMFSNLQQKMVFNHTAAKFEDNLYLLTRKGVYPYEWMDDLEKMKNTELPPIAAFGSKLRGSGIKKDEYEYAQNVWKKFNCKTFEDYHKIYLISDVVLLADVFESFRTLSLTHYRLDPVFYYSLPGMSWNAMLQGLRYDNTLPEVVRTKGIQLITDYDMYLMFEEGIRGGNSGIMHRHACANNMEANGEIGLRELFEGYLRSGEKSFIKYLDANNLYGWAMALALPYGGFEWLENTAINIELALKSEDPNVGFYLDVDLAYPTELHDEHADFPLAPERMNITADMFSPFLKRKISECELSHSKENYKLCQTLKDKKRYKLDYRALRLYLDLGMKLEKVHRIVKYNQFPIFRTYIMKNTEMRKKSVTTFEKDFFKLMNNALFGKTMEDVRRHTNCVFVDHRGEEGGRKCVKRASSPFCKRFTRVNDAFTCYFLKKRKLTLNKPIFIGQSILDLSKVLMYDFHYNKMKKWYPGDKSKLLFTDTDSLTYHIKTDDFVADVMKNGRLDEFDTSNYDKNHIMFSKLLKAVLGKFKDEKGGLEIKEFIGLRAKCYSILMGMINGKAEESKRLKGIAKSVVRSQIFHNDYKQILDLATSCAPDSANTRNKFYILKSVNHQISTVEVNKISLSNTDDKRWIFDDGISSLPYGHYKLVQMREQEEDDFLQSVVDQFGL